MIFDVTVEVSLRPGIADPQGATIERALPALGFDGVSGVSVGKSIRFRVDAADHATASALVDDLCHRFLSNPVIEESTAKLSAVDAASGAAAVSGAV